MDRTAFWICAGLGLLVAFVVFLGGLKDWFIASMLAIILGAYLGPVVVIAAGVLFLVARRSVKHREVLRKLTGMAVGGVLMFLLFVPAIMGSLLIVKCRMENARDLVHEEVAPALERYRAKHGRYPESLEAANAEGVAIPVPGLEFRYHAWREEPNYEITITDPTSLMGGYVYVSREGRWVEWD